MDARPPTFPWNDLFPELQDVVRREFLDPCAVACLAMTCRKERGKRQPFDRWEPLALGAIKSHHLAILEEFGGGLIARGQWEDMVNTAAFHDNIPALAFLGHRGVAATDNIFVHALRGYGGVEILDWITTNYPTKGIRDEDATNAILASVRPALDRLQYLNERKLLVRIRGPLPSNLVKRCDVPTLQWIKERFQESFDNHVLGYAAARGDLEVLDWLDNTGHPVRGHTNPSIGYSATRHGAVVLQWLHERGYVVTSVAYGGVATYDNMEACKWLEKKDILLPLDSIDNLFWAAARWGADRFLRHLRAAGHQFTETTFHGAVVGRRASTMRWLHREGCPMGDCTIAEAITCKHALVDLVWMHSIGCPWGDEVFSRLACHRNGVEIAQWLFAHAHLPIPDDSAQQCYQIATLGDLDLLKLVHAHGFSLEILLQLTRGSVVATHPLVWEWLQQQRRNNEQVDK